jgi:hypothetical protein
MFSLQLRNFRNYYYYFLTKQQIIESACILFQTLFCVFNSDELFWRYKLIDI